MTGAAIAIDDAAATDTVLSVKERVFAANRALPVRRQRLVYRPGPRGMEALADDETLGGAGVARDGTAELDVLLAELTAAEVAALGQEVCGALLGQLSIEGVGCCANDHVFVYGDQEADDIEIQKHIDSLDTLIDWFATPEQLEENGLTRISDIFPGIDLK